MPFSILTTNSPATIALTYFNKLARSWLKAGSKEVNLFIFSFQLLILITSQFTASAQQPGGVNGTKLWFVTEKAQQNYLVNRSGKSSEKIKTGAQSINNLNINFYPATYFPGINIPIKIENFKANYITGIGIFYPENPVSESKEIFWVKQDQLTNETFPNKVVEAGKEKFKFGNDRSRTTIQIKPPFTDISNAMKTGLFIFPWKKVNYSRWDENVDIELGTSFKGYIPELIVYAKKLSESEINKVQSYLSIKYGTTLDTSYTNSVGNIIWDINDQKLRLFHNRVIAVGRDTTSGLFQNKSNTTYEDNGFTAFKFGADEELIAPGAKFIPTGDKPSTYRSITIELSGKNSNNFPDKNFLFFGDNNGRIELKEIAGTTFSSVSKKYPNLHIISNRSWLAYNQNINPDSTKLVIAGKDFQQNWLFNTLYKPYDYQLYRFVLIVLEDDTIKSVALNSYFGREHFSDNKFNTRTLVWNNLVWNQNSVKYHNFTFGRVPILNFLQIGKAGTQLTPLNQYPYLLDYPVSNIVEFDTLKTAIVFKLLEDKKIEFTISPGIPPLNASLFPIENGKLVDEINNAFVTANESVESVDENQIESDIQSSSTSTEEEQIGITSDVTRGFISRHIPVLTQIKWKNWPVKFTIKSSKIDRNKKYLIRVVDSIGQVTTLPFKTTSSN